MTAEQPKKVTVSKKNRVLIVGGVCILLIVILLVSSLKPARSVAAFCETYKQENTRLERSSGTTYSVKPFTHSSSSPKDFAESFNQLEKVAPKDVEPDVKTLKQIFEKIDKDPSQVMSASLSGLGAESNVSDWTSQHCQ